MRLLFILLSLSLSLLFVPILSIAGNVYEHFPQTIDADGKYVFYSHGLIVEGINPTPIHSRWGTYEFPQIKEALSDNQYNLIAYHRPKDTNPKLFANKLVNDVRYLLKKGVKPKNITLVGFSRGGAITILASDLLANQNINFVILAGCGRYLAKNPGLVLVGNIYSIYETSDSVGSCQFLIDRSKSVSNFIELSLSTGKEHGAFYTPLSEWITPVKSWVTSN